MSEAIIDSAGKKPGGSPALEDLNDLYLFTLVVDKGSFTAASRTAGLTTSRISRRIADLEERLGLRLLHRTTRKLALTSLGAMYYQHCKAMVTEAEAAAELVEQLQASPRGRVRMTCPALMVQSVVGPMMTEFMHQYPDVNVTAMATDRFVDLIDEGFDVAIRIRSTPLEDSNLVARTIGQSRSHLVASPEFLRRYGRPTEPGDLAALPSLGKSRHDRAYTWSLTAANKQTTVIPFHPLLDSDDWILIKQAALAGLGIAAIPEELCPELSTGELEIVLPDWKLPGSEVHLVYTSRRFLIPAVRSFIDFAAERLAAVCQAGAQLDTAVSLNQSDIDQYS